jgi:hypothetical protein
MKATSINDKTSVLLKIFDYEKLSQRMKVSLPEINKSIKSWPQLGSEVMYGGSLTAGFARSILLNQIENFERRYFGIEHLLTSQSN